MKTIVEFKRENPIYADMPDADLAKSLHAKYYADMPYSAFYAKVMPNEFAEVPGVAESVLIGAGRTGDKLAAGTRKLFNLATGDDEDLQTIRAEQATRDAGYAQLQQDRPVASFVGEMLPYMAAPMGLGSGAARTAANVGARGLKAAGARQGAAGLLRAGRALGRSTAADAAITGGLLGGATYGEDQGAQAALGAAGGLIGDVAGRGAARLARPVQSRLGGMKERVADWAKAKGFKLTPGQATGSQPLIKAEAAMRSTPPTSGPLADIAEHNQRKINRIALEAVGASGEEVSDTALGRAHDRLSSRFKALTQDAQIDAGDFIDQVGAKMREMDIDDMFDIEGVEPWLERVVDRAKNGKLSGADYQRLQSRINSKARSIFRSQQGDREFGFALIAMKDALDDAAERSLGKAQRKAFGKVRRQWKNKVALEAPGVVNTGTGDVSAASLANVLKRMDKTGFLRGKDTSDFYEAARFGQAFKDIADSGTATRSYLQNLMTQGLLLGGAGGAAGYASDQGAAPGVLAGLGALGAIHGGANLMTRGYLGSGGYPFTRGLLPPLTERISPQAVRGLLGRAGAGAGAQGYLSTGPGP